MKTPKLPESRVRELLAAGKVTSPVAVLAVRGYWSKSMGSTDRNDVGIHDDAWFAVGPGMFMPLQANTDPSRLGWNPGVGKNFAMLVPGLWHFEIGAHKGRTPAFRQPEATPFTVWRAKDMDQVLTGTAKQESGYYAINIHDTGSDDEDRTSSWGCQTAQTKAFAPWANKVQAAMKAAGQKQLPYLLINGPIA